MKSGMVNAKAKGKKIGRPEVTRENLPDKFWKYYEMYRMKQINISEMAHLLGCTRTTVYKYISLANTASIQV